MPVIFLFLRGNTGARRRPLPETKGGMSIKMRNRIVAGVIGSAVAGVVYSLITDAGWLRSVVFAAIFFVLYTFAAMPLTDKFLLRKNKKSRDKDA